jgi:inner membrane protein involved in colicin E2 resistance
MKSYFISIIVLAGIYAIAVYLLRDNQKALIIATILFGILSGIISTTLFLKKK